MAGQFPREGLCILKGLGGLDLELGTDALLNDLVEWSGRRRRPATGWWPSCSG